MNAKTTKIAKKILRQVPPRAIEAGTALVIGKALKGKRRTTQVVTAIGVIAISHYIVEWASRD
jgi:hypothetical protein